MRSFKIILVTLAFLAVLSSCDNKLHVNANWKDITVVYGLLNQNTDTTYIKITKAFLGDGNAMMYAKIPDSSNYPDKLDVKLEAWLGSTLVNTYHFDTITIHTKQKGDSIFFYPIQLVYFCKTGHLDENNTYRLKITHKKTGIVDSASTKLVRHFAIDNPDPFIKTVDYRPGQYFSVKFEQGYGGKRYQLVIRFHYYETTASGTANKYVDWLVFNDYEVGDPYQSNPQPITQLISSDIFYKVVKGSIKSLAASPGVISRTPFKVDYIFSVASDDLNTYMSATEPSLSIIQERPSFSNIYNGIGLFSSEYVNEVDSVTLGAVTHSTFGSDTAFIHRGFGH
jgi:hypothetical protein